MKWMRFRVRTNTASEDIVVSAMADIGLYGAEIEDKVPLSGRELEELFIDEAPVQAIADDDGRADLACLNFYVEIAADKDAAHGAQEASEGDAPAVPPGLMLKLSEEEEITPEALKERMEEALADLKQYSDIGDGTITLSVTEDIDWRDNWKQYFHKFFIDDVLILPSWEQIDEDERRKAAHVLHIDPGAAFGTGLHETTRLAVRGLRRVLDPGAEAGASAASKALSGDKGIPAATDKQAATVLDIGTGSGVLSILALKFGAGYAAGIDLDPLAVLAAEENRERNALTKEQMCALRGDIIGDEAFRGQVLGLIPSGRYDIIVANILPNVLVPLAPVLPLLMHEESTVVYSGILLTKAQEVTEALTAAGLSVVHKETLGEWCSLTARRM